jgi:alkaline phosphatase
MSPEKGSVVFVHPDGTGLSGWGTARLMKVGPDGTLNWDRLEKVGVYRGHMRTSLGATSQAGATSHAYGVKVHWASFDDSLGGIVAKAHGLNSHLLPLNVDNTDIYRLMYATLFGVWLP